MNKSINLKKLLGNNIALWRHERKLTQSELAELCRISDVSLSRIENGSTWPKDSTLQKLCTALNVDPHVLFFSETVSSGTGGMMVADPD
ncbi:MAG: helix-turn-helix transcriptional regulator [Treponema sp.]|nr:helix-turn-helix transcriptional regulator [Treponema sp.]